MARMNKKDIETLTERLHKAVEDSNFYFDGVDTAGSFGNSKTERFVERIGVDAAIDVLLDMLKVTKYCRFSPARDYREEDAHEYIDFNYEVTDKYSLFERVYVKVFHFGEGQIPVFVIHD